MPHTVTVRPLVLQDEAVWRPLWQAYLTFYKTELPAAVYASTFARLISGADHEFRGLIAQTGGQTVGIAHYLFHRTCWQISDVCYLQDLFTAPQARGKGVARALIEAVYAAADAADAPDVYWNTAENNYPGRALYDRIGVRTPFIEYNRVR